VHDVPIPSPFPSNKGPLRRRGRRSSCAWRPPWRRKCNAESGSLFSYGDLGSLRIRKRIEEAFGWVKMVARQERTKFRGREQVGRDFTFASAAYNLAPLPNLLEAA
jgi:hypothetical protein